MESEFKINKRGVGKTLKQWATLGFVPKRGRKGELRYGNRGELSKGKKPRLYFDPEDVKEDKNEARVLLGRIAQEEHPSLNQRGRTLHQWIKQGFIPKKGCNGHLRYPSYASNCRDEEYLYFDPEEVVKGMIEESPHAQKVIEKESNRRWNTTGKTLDQWLNLGFVPKRGAKPTERYISYKAYSRYGTTCDYYDPNQVREDKERAILLTKKIKDAKRREREERARKVTAKWRELIGQGPVMLFDCETTGLSSRENDILSLSWMVTDPSFNNVIKEETRYFEWPNESRVTFEAIEVNGLTREKLANLGTCDRREALAEFFEDVEKVTLLIAHNLNFDFAFVKQTALREGLDTSVLLRPRRYCTMVGLTGYCALRYPGLREYKWPKLCEAAERLRIKTDDINWHSSASDTEIVRRIMVEIINKAIVAP